MKLWSMQLIKSYKAFLNTISYKASLKNKNNLHSNRLYSEPYNVKAEALGLGAFASGVFA